MGTNELRKYVREKIADKAQRSRLLAIADNIDADTNKRVQDAKVTARRDACKRIAKYASDMA